MPTSTFLPNNHNDKIKHDEEPNFDQLFPPSSPHSLTYPEYEPGIEICSDANPNSFLKLDAINIRNTKVYKKSLCLSVITDVFVRKYISKFSRTTDQMIQAARSVKQNLVEGAYDGATSKEMEIKLFNVARGSLNELLDDYLDFLFFNKLKKWEINDDRLMRTRQRLINEMNPEWYATLPDLCSMETCANIILTLIHQVDALIKGLLEKTERDFLANGGLRENMSKHRISARSNTRSSNPTR